MSSGDEYLGGKINNKGLLKSSCSIKTLLK